jgi:hypothetical protein
MEHINTLCGQNAVYINSVRASQETHYVAGTKPNRLMLFGEIIAVYCENHTEHTHTLKAEFSTVEGGGIYNNHWALKSSNCLSFVIIL